MAMAKVPVASATARAASAHSCHVTWSVLSLGTGTPAWSKSVRLMNGPVTVNWVM